MNRLLAYIAGLLASTTAMYFATGGKPLNTNTARSEILAILVAAGFIWTIFFVLSELARTTLANFRIGLLFLLVLTAVGYFSVLVAQYIAFWLNYDGLLFASTIDARIFIALALVLISAVTDSGTREALTDVEQEDGQM